METQLLKLNPPYNIICNKGRFAKHIATLIVVDKEQSDAQPGHWETKTQSFPVVDYGDGSPEGDVWSSSEVKDCRVVARESVNDMPIVVSLAWFSQLLKFNHGQGIVNVNGKFYELTPLVLQSILSRYNISVVLPNNNNNHYEVELKFTEYSDPDEKLVYVESVGGNLYFNTFYNMDDDDVTAGDGAMEDIIYWWKDYLDVIRPMSQGGKDVSIEFTTKNKKYDLFVKELNWQIKLENGAGE